uniref:AAA+ ATPase domain-containing protein n=1 Tax=Leersia perrieri TaxID=77586 RepID=A0A0D9VG74_9ORYZ
MSTGMEHAIVSAATGVLSPLIGKLSTLLEKEYSSLKGVRGEIVSLREEVSSMNAMLLKLAAEDNPDVQDRVWGNQIRDLSYDIEDCIDDFMLRVDQHGNTASPDGDGKAGVFHRCLSKMKSLGARHDIAGKIRELKARADVVSKRHERYRFQGSSSPFTSSSSGCAVGIDPRLHAFYAKEDSLVGIQEPRDEVIRLLASQGEEEGSVNKLKVVSIVGFGGLGKTTLASAVHRKLGEEEQFDCRLVVPVSQSPDIMRLFQNILLQDFNVKPCTHNDLQGIINQLRSHLLDKRYLIILDDLWDVSVWENALKCAFPDNNLGSRVVTTTRDNTVAEKCCGQQRDCIYNMKPLNETDSKKLFFNRIFGSENDCPNELKSISDEILRKCHGLPLAIITIASLLASQASKEKDEWEHVRNSLGSKLGTDPSLEMMQQILNLSYKNLHPHAKTCFLYLGAYPEDYVIWKDDLVRQWAAEGFVHGVENARGYFNQLVNRSMIQPVKIGYNDEVLSCRVHDMMLELIIRKYSVEENFLTAVVGNSQEVKGSIHNVRRLFHYSEVGRRQAAPAMRIDLQKVRSIAAPVIASGIHQFRFLDMKFLRVLVLEFIYNPKEQSTQSVDLSVMCKLLLLRYIKIHSECMLKLPPRIRMLQHLETLEIVSRADKAGLAIPSDVAQLPRLSYLSILPHMLGGLPDNVGTMIQLRSLAFFILEENSLDIIKSLRLLTNLRELYLISASGGDGDGTEIVALAPAPEMDALQSSVSGMDCKLYLNAWSMWLPRVPQWVGRLKNIYGLELGVGKLCKDGVSVLADLPAMARLDLWIKSAPTESIVIAGAGFPMLKHLIFTCRALCLTFEAGAMPKLRRLDLEFNADGGGDGCFGNALVGVDHLADLRVVSAKVGGFSTALAAAAAAEEPDERSATMFRLRDAVDLHPKRPRLDITYTQGKYGLSGLPGYSAGFDV